MFPGSRCLLVQGTCAEGMKRWPKSCWGAVDGGLGGGGESAQEGTADSPVFFVSLQTSPTVISLRRRRRREMVSTPVACWSAVPCAQDALESKWLEPLVPGVEQQLLTQRFWGGRLWS